MFMYSRYGSASDRDLPFQSSRAVVNFLEPNYSETIVCRKD